MTGLKWTIQIPDKSIIWMLTLLYITSDNVFSYLKDNISTFHDLEELFVEGLGRPVSDLEHNDMQF